MKDEDVIFERILKWAMFALVAFITRGGIFILYCAYHIMTGHQELEENHRNKSLTQDELAELNKPENLTEEDKQYFYEHPFAYKDKNGKYKERKEIEWTRHLIIPSWSLELPKIDDYGKGIYWNGFGMDLYNPRFKLSYGYYDWWNKPYWEKIENDEIAYLLKKKEGLEEQICLCLLGHKSGSDAIKTECDIDDVRKNIAENKLYLTNLGEHYAQYKQQLAWFEKITLERKQDNGRKN